MGIVHTGVDTIEIARLAGAIARHGERFLARVYTASELATCGKRLESLAVRFAAKEATAKALGTGIGRHGIRWVDIEIYTDSASGAPELRLLGAAATRAQKLGVGAWSVSLSHDRERALAFVVMLG